MTAQVTLGANINEIEYTERVIKAMHPNKQRVFAGMIRSRVESLIFNAGVYGFSTVREYLAAEQWDSFEQWFKISFPFAQ